MAKNSLEKLLTNRYVELAGLAAGAYLLYRRWNKSVEGVGVIGQDAHKRAQLQLILANNPADERLLPHTWVRTEDDILTYTEALEYDGDWSDGYTPDYTAQDIERALSSGELMVYSSYPIKEGIFVTPSKMEAQSYAGSKNVYSKKVKLSDVAWLDGLQGQYAPVTGIYDDIVTDARSLKSPFDIDTIVLYRIDDYYAAFDTSAVALASMFPNMLILEDYEDGSVVSFHFSQLDKILPNIVKAGYRVKIGDELRVKRNYNPQGYEEIKL